jgi:hypothetical protein
MSAGDGDSNRDSDRNRDRDRDKDRERYKDRYRDQKRAVVSTSMQVKVATVFPIDSKLFPAENPRRALKHTSTWKMTVVFVRGSVRTGVCEMCRRGDTISHRSLPNNDDALSFSTEKVMLHSTTSSASHTRKAKEKIIEKRVRQMRLVAGKAKVNNTSRIKIAPVQLLFPVADTYRAVAAGKTDAVAIGTAVTETGGASEAGLTATAIVVLVAAVVRVYSLAVDLAAVLGVWTAVVLGLA